MPNPWNEFRAEHKGKGYTSAELSAMYKAQRGDFDNATACKQHIRKRSAETGMAPLAPGTLPCKEWWKQNKTQFMKYIAGQAGSCRK